MFQFALVRPIDHPTMSPQTLLCAVADRSFPLATTARGFFISVRRIFRRLYHRTVASLRLRQLPARQRAADSSRLRHRHQSPAVDTSLCVTPIADKGVCGRIVRFVPDADIPAARPTTHGTFSSQSSNRGVSVRLMSAGIDRYD